MAEVIWRNPNWNSRTWNCKCSECASIIEFDKTDDAATYISGEILYECPVCGNLNSRDPSTIYYGEIPVTPPYTKED